MPGTSRWPTGPDNLTHDATIDDVVDAVNAMQQSSGGAISQTGDVIITSDSDSAGGGDLIFKKGTAEVARLNQNGLSIKDPTGDQTLSIGGVQLALYGKSTGAVSNRQPVIDILNNADGAGYVKGWQIGVDVANSVNDDFFIGRRSGASIGDYLYIKDYGAAGITTGIAITPPSSAARLQVGNPDSSAMHVLGLRQGSGSTGDYINAIASSGNVIFRVDSGGSIYGPDVAGGGGGLSVRSVATGQPTLRLYKITGQTGPLLKIVNDSGSDNIVVFPNGNNAYMQFFNTSDGIARATISHDGSHFDSHQASGVPLYVKGFSGQTGILLDVRDNNSNSLSGFNKGGYFFTNKITAPADADLSANQLMFWFDPTNGAAKMMVKAKQADGTVRTGSLALA